MSHCRVHLHEANTRDSLILNIRIPLKKRRMARRSQKPLQMPLEKYQP